MFPTPVGMNRKQFIDGKPYYDVPHACGDEPLTVKMPPWAKVCSPRLWG